MSSITESAYEDKTMQSKSRLDGTMLRGIEKTIQTDIQKVNAIYRGLGVTASVFSFFQGRATFFALLFSIVGIIGLFKHYDLTSFALLVGAIFTGVIGHSIKEDYFERRRNGQSPLETKQ